MPPNRLAHGSAADQAARETSVNTHPALRIHPLCGGLSRGVWIGGAVVGLDVAPPPSAVLPAVRGVLRDAVDGDAPQQAPPEVPSQPVVPAPPRRRRGTDHTPLSPTHA
eukprot:553122-Pyramimonas_sp.AAC.1